MNPDVLLELKKTLTYLFCPAPCLACEGIDRDLERPLGLCRACREQLVRVRDPCCPTCARPLAAAAVPPGFRCGRCRLRRPPFEGLIAHWAYQPPLDRVVVALKFERLRFLGEHLAEGLAGRLAEDPPPVDAVVPVPLHWRRRLERGYNQADEIARTVAEKLDLPRLDVLRRRRPTRPQTDLPREERGANLRSAFRCRRPERISERGILLVDDVVTTGATLGEAARCLRRAGSGPIFAAVVARTPEPGEVRSGGRTERYMVRKVALTTRRDGLILGSRRGSPARRRSVLRDLFG